MIRVKVMFWDKSGRQHFEEQGYTREIPPENNKGK